MEDVEEIKKELLKQVESSCRTIAKKIKKDVGKSARKQKAKVANARPKNKPKRTRTNIRRLPTPIVYLKHREKEIMMYYKLRNMKKEVDGGYGDMKTIKEEQDFGYGDMAPLKEIKQEVEDDGYEKWTIKEEGVGVGVKVKAEAEEETGLRKEIKKEVDLTTINVKMEEDYYYD